MKNDLLIGLTRGWDLIPAPAKSFGSLQLWFLNTGSGSLPAGVPTL